MEAQIEQQLEKILPEDLARTFESAYHVFQGNHEHMDDLLKNGGVLLRKVAQKLSPTQTILGIAAIAAVAVILVNRATDDDHEGEAKDVSDRDGKRQIGGNQDKK
ncbi:hypothetical protein [Hymenobacter properus]|uniref:Uncharacterized protein n=1 Tax=Hymenobacter properus TaxID=2791026 RepID=A0A931BP14_9BACT|nr:hypothetical protein [Hymenobacter properus]MBF9142960.1 hypothetical protein [Hymenobacter properus]MBR7721767.1 hypothetical protein [Microvirga sp. SRT04]